MLSARKQYILKEIPASEHVFHGERSTFHVILSAFMVHFKDSQ